MPGLYAVRECVERDLPAIARVHLDAYSKDHFTSRLSPTTLRAYYGLFLGGGSHIIVLTPDDDAEQVLGFAVFGHGIGARIAQFKREHRGAIAGAALRHPLAAGRKAVGRLANSFALKNDVEPAPYLLLSIAVAKRNVGAGGRLLAALLERAQAEGAKCVGLYVNGDNLGAINSYVAHGFRFRSLRAGQYYMERFTG